MLVALGKLSTVLEIWGSYIANTNVTYNGLVSIFLKNKQKGKNIDKSNIYIITQSSYLASNV